MINNDVLLNTLINYGLAGIVIYIFYLLVCNHLKELKQSIEKLDASVRELRDAVIKLIEHKDNHRYDTRLRQKPY